MVEPGNLLAWMGGLGALMALVWVTRLTKEPLRAKIMSAAFATMAIICLGMNRKWPVPALIALGVLLLGLLMIDIGTRSAAFKAGGGEAKK